MNVSFPMKKHTLNYQICNPNKIIQKGLISILSKFDVAKSNSFLVFPGDSSLLFYQHESCMTFKDQRAFEEHKGLVFISDKTLTLVKFMLLFYLACLHLCNTENSCNSIRAQEDNAYRISSLQFLKKFNLLFKFHLIYRTVSVKPEKSFIYKILVHLFIYYNSII